MKLWEAVKAMEDGKKVRCTNWGSKMYIKLDEYNHFIDENGYYYELVNTCDNWELYDDRKEVPLAWRMVYKKLKETESFVNSYLDTDHICQKGECCDCPFEKMCDAFYDLIDILNEQNEFYKLDKPHEFEIYKDNNDIK